MVNRRALKRLQRCRARDPVTLHDRLGVDLLPDEFLGFAQQLRRQHGDTGRPIPNLIVLHLRDVHEDLGGGIVKLDGFQDGSAIVCDVDVARRSRLQDLVHALGSER